MSIDLSVAENYYKMQNIRLDKTPNIKDEISKVIMNESSFIPKYYNKFAPDTILEKGKPLLDLLINYPDDMIKIDPFPPFVGYQRENGIKYDAFELLEKNEWFDEWGVKMGHRKTSVGACPIDNPLKQWGDYEAYCGKYFPRGSFPSRMEKAKDRIKKIDKRDEKYLIGRMVIGIFERAVFIRGFERLCEDLYYNQKMLRRLLREITNYNLAFIEEWASLKADAIYMTDDWGAQDNLLISPNKWREIFKPYYKEIFNCIHNNNMKVIFHSCGNITRIIGDLIEIGVDVIHPLQAQINDYEYLAKEYSGNLTVMGGLDVQKELVSGGKEDIKSSLDYFVEIFHSNDCGIIFCPTNTVVPGTPFENIKFAFEYMNELSAKSKEII